MICVSCQQNYQVCGIFQEFSVSHHCIPADYFIVNVQMCYLLELLSVSYFLVLWKYVEMM